MRSVRVQPPQRLPTIAILSYEFWQRRYGGNAAILGQTMGNAQIAGVLAPRFEMLLPPDLGVDRAPDVYTAARLDFTQRRFAILRAIGRLKDGVTLERAQSKQPYWRRTCERTTMRALVSISGWRRCASD